MHRGWGCPVGEARWEHGHEGEPYAPQGACCPRAEVPYTGWLPATLPIQWSRNSPPAPLPLGTPSGAGPGQCRIPHRQWEVAELVASSCPAGQHSHSPAHVGATTMRRLCDSMNLVLSCSTSSQAILGSPGNLPSIPTRPCLKDSWPQGWQTPWRSATNRGSRE